MGDGRKGTHHGGRRVTEFDRQPPYSAEAEISVLGALLIDQGSEAFDIVSEILNEEMFYREANRRIYRAMMAVWEMDGEVDVITTRARLAASDELEDAGGVEYLATLIDAVPTAANVGSYARIVKDCWTRRRVIDTASQLIRDSYETTSAAQAVADAESSLSSLLLENGQSDFSVIKESLWPVFETVERWQENPGGATGLKSGYKSLDRLTAGFDPGDLIIFAGRPSMGKTSLVLNIAAHLAIEEERPVAICSLEMSREALTLRLLTTEARVDSQRLKMSKLETTEYQRLATASGKLNVAPIYIDDHPSSTVTALASKARRLVRSEKIELVIIDYMQLIEGDRSMRSRVEQMSGISRRLKLMATDLSIPVIAVSQLSRGPESRTDKRPILSDLRDSGAIEQDADLVAFVYRPEYYMTTEQAAKADVIGLAELIIAKHRNGPTGSVKLHFEPTTTRFSERAAV